MTFQQIQNTFNGGELAPSLFARTDLAKYKACAALMENWFVDYRGGASTRPGTRYILHARVSSSPIRLIPFQASSAVSYAIEFGELYMRFYADGAPVLEAATTITGASQANPCVITSVAHGYSTDDWVFIASVGGMTQLNSRYFIITRINADTYSLRDLWGANVNSSAYTAYTTGGTARRVFTLNSPYSATDLALLKFAQNINTLTLCHPSYPPYVLTLGATSTAWSITQIAFGATISAPAITVATTLGAGTVNYAYVACAVDANGQESAPSAFGTLASVLDLRTVAGTNTVTISAAIPGALSYNFYKASVRYSTAVPAGSQFGFVGNTTGLVFIDSNIDPDFSQGPPIPKNPFLTGYPVTSYTVTTAGTYTTVPTITVAAPTSGIQATASAVLGLNAVPTVSASDPGISVGMLLTNVATGAVLQVASIGPIVVTIVNAGSISSGAVPTNPATFSNALGGVSATFTCAWGLTSVLPIIYGSGYTSAPVVTISGGGGGAVTAVLGSQNAGNPSVPAFFQQRLALMGSTVAPQRFDLSQPVSYYNFDVTEPTQEDDAISGNLVSLQLNSIRAALPMPTGLVILTDRQAWLLQGDEQRGAITPTTARAQAQSYNGISNVPPLVANDHILYVQAKGSYVRDLVYNIYSNVYTGSDISVISNHLFYGYTITEWCWAEEPFKIAWAVRDDGNLLSLTYLKDQEIVGWSHHVTDGDFKSVCAITETGETQEIDAVYLVVERTINGQTVKYIERMAERIFPNGAEDAWCVDAGLQYDSTPATSFTGAEHLAGEACVGLADGVAFTATVSATGSFTLATAASKVTIGLGYTCDLQTLPIDSGEPTIQGRQKKVASTIVKVQDTLGLYNGTSTSNLVVMNDLVVGRVGSQTNTVVTSAMVTGDVQAIMDPRFSEQGQYYFRQSQPFPASILGVVPFFALGDGPNDRKNR